LAAIDLDDQKAVDFVLTNHPIEGRKLIEGTTAQSIGFDELLQCSGGNILYKWHAEFIFRTYTLCTAEEATHWVKDWNRKKPAALTSNYEIGGQHSLPKVLASSSYDRYSSFIYTAPIKVYTQN